MGQLRPARFGQADLEKIGGPDGERNIIAIVYLRKAGKMAVSETQDGALANDIHQKEITAQMAGEGLRALSGWESNGRLRSDLVAAIYSNMEAARRLSPEETQLDCLVFGKD